MYHISRCKLRKYKTFRRQQEKIFVTWNYTRVLRKDTIIIIYKREKKDKLEFIKIKTFALLKILIQK